MGDGNFQLLLVAILAITLLQPWMAAGQDTCVKINSCSCKNSQGTIDLSPLDSGGGSNPKFKDIPSIDAGSNSFSWNPCTPFSEGDGSCTSVAACQIQPGLPSTYFNTGLQNTATFQTDGENQVTIQYKDQTATRRTTLVKLVCDPSQDPGSLTAVGEIFPAAYRLTYVGRYACPVKNNVTTVPVTINTTAASVRTSTATPPPVTGITGPPWPPRPPCPVPGIPLIIIICLLSVIVILLMLLVYCVWNLKLSARRNGTKISKSKLSKSQYSNGGV